MKAKGRANSTIERSLDILTRLSKMCDLNNPKEVKLTIANNKWKNKNHVKKLLRLYYIEKMIILKVVKSGIGVFGKNSLLLSTKFSPRIRLVSVITDAFALKRGKSTSTR